MATKLNPDLTFIKQPSEIPTELSPSGSGFFFYYDGSILKKAPLSNIYSLISAGFQFSINPDTPIPADGWDKGVYTAEVSGIYPNQDNITVDLNDGFTGFIYDGTNWTTFILPVDVLPIDFIQYENTDQAVAGKVVKDEVDKTFDFKKFPNRFNKKDFRPFFQIDESTGDVIASNTSNALSGLIPVTPGEYVILNVMCYSNSNANSKILSLTNSIHLFNENGGYISSIHNGINANITIPSGTGFVRINPSRNPANTSFTDYADTLVFSRLDELAFGYLGYGQERKYLTPDYSFFKKKTLPNKSGFTNDVWNVPENATASSAISYSNVFISEYGGIQTAFLKIELLTANRNVLPMLFQNMSVMTNLNFPGHIGDTSNPNKSQQPKIELFEDLNPKIFYAVITGNVGSGNTISVQFVKFLYDFINDSGTVKLTVFNKVTDSGGKPLGYNFAEDLQELREDLEDVDASIIPKATTVSNERISSLVPPMIDAYVGESVNDYIVEHINDFEFLQPNYIEANASFDFNTLNSSMNGKFISIIEDIDLGGDTIDFENLNVKNLKLVFNGGRILNGKMRSYYTTCICNSHQAFSGVEILNQFLNPYGLPEWFGANIDGIDGGIGDFTSDDSFAMNQALKFASLVKLSGSRTMIVKKPIIMRSGNTIQADKNFTVKLGDASNCTLLKNEHIDIPHDGVNPVVYPSGFVRNANISITGGIWEGNGLKQNRANNPAVGDQADIIGTAIFADGDGASYFGCMMKFADIDNFTFTDAVIKDPRTYGVALGGLLNYRFENIRLIRTYHVENGDGIHLHGKNFNGVLKNINGQSGDDFIAVTTSEAQRLSIRVGDVIGLTIKDIYTYGLVDGATPATPKNITNGIPPNTRSMRCVRLSYTDHVIDDVYIENVRGHGATFMNNVCIAYLQHSLFSGTEGKAGNITVSGITDTDGCNAVSYGANTIVDKITLKDVYYRYSGATEIPALMRPADNFGGEDQWALTKIGTICIDNVRLFKDNDTTYDMANGLIWSLGTIDNVIIDKLVLESRSGLTNFNSLVSGRVGYLNITNSIVNLRNLFSSNNVYSDYTTIRESGNEFSDEFVMNGSPKRANTESVIVATNPLNPKFGDKILKADGLYLYTGTWNKL